MMTKLEEIKELINEDVDKFVEFLIIQGETSTTEYDYNDEPYELKETIWHTPFGNYPCWWSYDDVKYEIKELLNGEA